MHEKCRLKSWEPLPHTDNTVVKAVSETVNAFMACAMVLRECSGIGYAVAVQGWGYH